MWQHVHVEAKCFQPVITMVLVSLFFLLPALAGVFPQKLQEINAKSGEMVALRCDHYRDYNRSVSKLIWTSHTTEDMDLTNSMSSGEQRQMDVLVHGRNLVILSASANHQGNYSCSLGNASSQFWFRLTVHTTQAKKYEKRCNTQESCTLYCPEVNIPDENNPNFTSKGVTWHKDGESSAHYISSLEERDQGVYTCTRSYMYQGQIYNMTFTVVLKVQLNKQRKKSSEIISPRMNDEFHVDLGSAVVIDCKAVLNSDLDEVFWLSGETFVEINDSLPVYYNFTIESKTEEIIMRASLVFRKVSEEYLSKNYTCKLDTVNQPSSSVTITLQQRPPAPSYVSLALTISCIVVVMVLTVVIYVKFKITISLFLRDTLGCHSNTSDVKSYDAFLMCYKSDTDTGLSEQDRKWLMSVLEDRFGYSLCLYDRDVLPGEAVEEAVLDCTEQSRTVVLVPTSSDHCPGSGLLSAIHAALVDRQTRLVFIQTETAEGPTSGSVPEALQLLAETGDCVTWKGTSSMSSSSSFWKQLRYYLPAPQRAAKIYLLPQTH